MRFWSIILFAVIWMFICISIVFLFFVGAANAQSPTVGLACGNRTDMIVMLQKQYGEVGRFIGISPDGTMSTELYYSDDCTSWTITVSDSKGLTCMVAEGKDCKVRDWPPGGNPS
jgi:hypothetical protein